MACDHDKKGPTDRIEFRLWRCGCSEWRLSARGEVCAQVAERLLDSIARDADAPQDIAKARDLVRRALRASDSDILRFADECAPAGEALQ